MRSCEETCPMSRTEEAVQYFEGLTSCCLREDGKIVLAKVKEVLFFIMSERDGANGGALFETTDGQFYVFAEWQDYTGHGCQCDCQVFGPFPDSNAAVRLGFDNDLRERLGLEIFSYGADAKQEL